MAELILSGYILWQMHKLHAPDQPMNLLTRVLMLWVA